MDYNFLKNGYKDQQKARVSATAAKIKERQDAVSGGRTVPESDDIRIGTGRRLRAAVMFLDIVGFSGRANHTAEEQEENLRMLAFFFSEMFRIVDDYGGVVEKNTGDGLMAYFADGEGDPPAPGCHRAIACAMTMKYAHQHLINPVIMATNYPSVAFRLSVDYGPITIARVGAPQRFNSIVAIGVTANIASKLQAFTDAGQILIGQHVLDNLPQEWQQWVTPLGKSTGFVVGVEKAAYQAHFFTAHWTGNGY